MARKKMPKKLEIEGVPYEKVVGKKKVKKGKKGKKLARGFGAY